MKGYLRKISLFGTVLLVTFLGVITISRVQQAHAEPGIVNAIDNGTTAQYAASQQGIKSSGTNNLQPNINAGNNPNNGQPLNNTANTADSSECVLAHPLSGTTGACVDEFAAYIAYLSLWISSWILAMVGYLFDTVMKYTVLQMQSFLPSGVINIGWTDVRDIGNLIFIFMAIYIGISEIIGRNFGKTKILIRNLIIMALLVNFSLFFTKFLIDASNVLSIAFYNIIINGSHDFDAFTRAFAGPLGIPTIYSFPTPGATGGAIDALAQIGFFSIVIVGIGGSTFLIVTAMTFATAGILFLIRFVTFIFLLVLSPIAFLFLVLPQLSGYAKKWWETLAGQLIFAPLYMILILLVAVLINSPTSGLKVTALASALVSPSTPGTTATVDTGNVNAASNQLNIGSCNTSSQNGCDTVSQIMFFIIIILLMNGATMIAVQQASKGKGLVSEAVGWAQGAVQGAVRGTAGAAARGTVGRAAVALEEKLDTSAVGNSRTSRFVRSFTSGAVAKQDFGTSKSATQVKKENQKANEEFAKRIEKGVQKDFDEQLPEQRKTELNKNVERIADYQKTLADNQKRSSEIDAEILALNQEYGRLNTVPAENTSAESLRAVEENRRQREEREREKTEIERRNSEANQEIKKREKENEMMQGRIDNEAPATETERATLRKMQADKARQFTEKNKVPAWALGTRTFNWVFKGGLSRDGRASAAKLLKDRSKGKKKSQEEEFRDLMKKYVSKEETEEKSAEKKSKE